MLPSRVHCFHVFGSSAHWIEPSRIQCWGQQMGVVLGLSPLAKPGGDSHIRKLTLFYLLGGSHDGEGKGKNKGLKLVLTSPSSQRYPYG